MKKYLLLTLAAVLLMPLTAMANDDAADYLEEKQDIDEMVEDSFAELFEEVPSAKPLYEQAYGYAMFGVLKFALGVTGGGGGGVAVAKPTDERIYMNMGTGGIGIEAGGAAYNILVLFENEDEFNEFVYDDNWQADAAAEAVIGEAGVSAVANFEEGLAVYQFDEEGLLAGVDISGSIFWIDRELSPQAVAKKEQMEEMEERAELDEDEGVQR